MEIWKPIDGYDGYEVSSLGRVKSFKYREPRILRQGVSRGYALVVLSKNGKEKNFRVHRLVAKAFIPNPENKRTVNHIDGNKLNNCAENLEWATHSENEKHAYENGLMSALSGEKSARAKLTNAQVVAIRAAYIRHSKEFGSVALGKKFGISARQIQTIVQGGVYCGAGGKINREKQRYTHLTEEQKDEIRHTFIPRDKNFGARALALKFGVDHHSILQVINKPSK